MKKLLLLGMALIATASFAQPTQKLDKKRFSTIEPSMLYCIYEYKIVASNGVEENYNTILQIGESATKFWDYTSFVADSMAYIAIGASSDEIKSAKEQQIRQQYFFDGVIFQNYPEDKITVHDVITPNYYRYTEDKDLFEWKLEQDTTTICEQLCYKATASYGGRDWIAWYAPSMAVSAGPWKFSNLPGLILMVEDAEGVHSFRAITIRQSDLPIYEEKNAQRIKSSRDSFIENKNEFEKDPMSNIPIESISDMVVTRFGDGANDKTATINGVPLRMRANGYTPLELK
ncbi:MAG: GLPGLI family protein [Rikenellaceae bacterium]